MYTYYIPNIFIYFFLKAKKILSYGISQVIPSVKMYCYDYIVYNMVYHKVYYKVYHIVIWKQGKIGKKLRK